MDRSPAAAGGRNVIGARIGSYRITRELGRGGMGAVYAAEHEGFGKRAAIKVIHSQLSTRGEMVTRFFNEARAAAAIDDPGIVQVFDVGTHDGSAFLVMELLTGETVEARVRRLERLAPRDALRIARQVAATLAKAHASGIVHRDLKPDNLFVVRDDEVAGGERTKVLDFGIAKLISPSAPVGATDTGEVLGTPMYMSPEQCRGEGIDHRTDLYSLGGVLYRMLTGRPPFPATFSADLIAAHLRETVVPPSTLAPEVPPEVDAIVLRCLEKDPDARFATMARLIDAIDDVIGGVPGAGVTRAPTHLQPRVKEAPTPTLLSSETEHADSTAPTRRSPLPAVIAAVVLVGVAIALYVITRPGPAPATVPSPAVDAGPVDARSLDAASAPDAGPTPDAAAPPDAIPAHRPRHTPDARVRALPPDASPVIDVDLDNDGIPDKR